ncbi:chromate transporter [Metabacillus idriensis]|uniref:chromate transporter n=1 Tax=Metabacillus idriensis TaxID=324768 RepID=UPI002812BAB0|nr:chromate transporter [Metabacillus idriensis]MDR0139024.1 chromate transporter [Metabacillus idriensis]
MKQWNIFIAFFRSGMLGFGGGPSTIPLVHREVVERFKWMNDDEFSDVLALGNTLPGPIATKMAGYIGYRIGGYAGMLNAVIATALPTVILMILLLTTLNAYKDEAWVRGMSQAVLPVVAVMLLTLTWDFAKKSSQSFGLLQTVLLMGASLFLMEALHVHPGILIGVLLLWAIFYKGKSGGKKEKGMDS